MTDAISSVLSQIRAHEMRMKGMEGSATSPISGPLAGGPTGAAQAPQGGGFAATLSKSLDNVSRVQSEAGELQKAFEMGDPRADLARVMVAMQQSQVAFRATVEVRNRLVQAYQDVMNMPI